MVSLQKGNIMSRINAVKNRVIFDAAMEANKGEATKAVLADKIGITVETLSDACLILLYGTSEEVQLTEGGVGVSTVAGKIRPRLTSEQRKAVRAKSKAASTFTDDRREALANEANLWAKFRPVLSGLDELPAPKDMIKIITGHRKRHRFVVQHLETAFNWMEEFVNEWRIVKPPEGGSNSGNGNSNVGTQHTEPSSE